MKRTTKRLSIAVVLVLSVGLFSACGSENNVSSNNALKQSITSESSTEELTNTESLGNDALTQEDELEKYCQIRLLSECELPDGKWINLEYNEDYPPESLWFQAIVRGTENEDHPQLKYVAVNLEGDCIGVLNQENSAIVSPFFDGVACIVDSETGERKLIDTQMEDVTSKYIDLKTGEEIVTLSADKTGITLWTRRTADTYDSHITDLFAKDMSGNIKQTWSSQNELTEDIEYVNIIEHINGSNYVYCYYDNYVILNVETGSVVSIGEQHSGIRLDTMFDDGSFMTASGNGVNYRGLTWHTPNGDVKKELLLYAPNKYENVVQSSYGEGLMYVKGEINDVLYQGFVDENGGFVINLDVNLNITNWPVYREGYALVELENDGGETFVTLLDKAGNFAFEPIKGEVLGQWAYFGKLEGHQYYIEQNDDFYYLNSDGSIEKADHDFSECFGFLGYTYVMAEDSFKVIK